jgi:hypothetical protein
MYANRRQMILLSLSLATLAVAGAGCGPAWTVVRSAPGKVTAQSRFAVLPVEYQDLKIGKKPEADWLAKKKPEQVRSWEADKLGIGSTYASKVTEGAYVRKLQVSAEPGARRGAVTIRPIVSFIEPGYYAGIAAAGAEIGARVQLADEGGVFEEIELKVGSGNAFSTGERVRMAAAELGRQTVLYLAGRAGVAK